MSGNRLRRAWQICSGLHRMARAAWMKSSSSAFRLILPGLGRGGQASARR